MVYCTNCGTQLKDDDLFCGNCGNKNVSGNSAEEVSTQPQRPRQTISTPNINKEVVSKHSKQIIGIIKDMLIKPISSIKKIINEVNKKTTIILNAILAVIQGLFSLWLLSHGVSLIDKIISEVSGFSGIFSGLFSPTKEALKIPYVEVFVQGIILYVITFGVLFIGIYIVSNLIYSTNTDSLNISKLVSLSAIPAFGAEFIFLLASYISLVAAIIILLIGLFISFSTLLEGTKNLINLPENILVFSISIIFTIMIGCVVFAAWKFTLMDIESIKKSILDTKNTKNSLMDLFN